MSGCSSMKLLCAFALINAVESAFWAWPKSPPTFLGRKPADGAAAVLAGKEQAGILQHVTSMKPAGKVFPEVEKRSKVEIASGPLVITGEEEAEPLNVQPMRVSKSSCRAEANLITSLEHLEDGQHKIGCVSACRFGEVRHSWRECLERCVENHLIRSTFISMLPEEHHAPHAKEVALPDRIRMSNEVKRKYRLDRGSEL
mmetsp:Transcript_23912/g.55743  ORF Transcript_23912/g.55743 Transcript_23912/m.55743 type:complete len:200 (+) Transcript_23912:76-675(+)